MEDCFLAIGIDIASVPEIELAGSSVLRRMGEEEDDQDPATDDASCSCSASSSSSSRSISISLITMIFLFFLRIGVLFCNTSLLPPDPYEGELLRLYEFDGEVGGS